MRLYVNDLWSQFRT